MLLAAVLILYIKYCGTVFIRAVEGPAAHLSSILKQVHSSLELGCCSMCLCFVAFFFRLAEVSFHHIPAKHRVVVSKSLTQALSSGRLDYMAFLPPFSSLLVILPGTTVIPP